MEDFPKQNLRYFTIISSLQYFQIVPCLTSFKTQILIQKSTMQVVYQKRQKEFTFENCGQHQTKFCSLILGVIQFEQQFFLCFVQNVYNQPPLPGFQSQTIYQIASVQFLPFSASIHKREQQFFNSMNQELLSFGFYFCFNRDLTHNLQALQKIKQKQTKILIANNIIASQPNQAFYWNSRIFDYLNSCQAAKEWRIPVVKGFYKRIFSFLNNHQIDYYLFSRRSKYRSGGHSYCRGINQNGNCANFIQTQQLVVFKGYVMSSVFVSGSVPIFWEKKSQGSLLKFTRRKQLMKGPFLQHMKKLNMSYGKIGIINLLELKIAQQEQLTQKFETIINECQQSNPQMNDYTRYFFYNFNKDLKQRKWGHIKQTMDRLQDLTKSLGFFMMEKQSGRVLTRQSGVYRLNGFQSVNRVNIFMQCLALSILKFELSLFDQQLQDWLGQNYLQQMLIGHEDQIKGFLRLYRYLWYAKIDFESLSYTGSRFQKAKNPFLDQISSFLKNISRIYNITYIQKIKQKAADIFLGHLSTKFNIESNEKRIENMAQFSINICTWNVNATVPQKLKNLPKIVQKFIGSNLIVFGIQQMIQLNATNNMIKQQEDRVASQWDQFLEKHLKQKNYICVQKLQMVGIMLIIFIDQQWKDSLKDVHMDYVKTGMGGQFGNKGGVAIRIHIFDTSLCFVCAHLAAGQGKHRQRVDDWLQIHRKAFQQSKSGIRDQNQIESSDYKFFFGDLNFRIEGQFKQICQILEQHCQNEKQRMTILDTIKRKDQLLKIRQEIDTHYLVSSYSQEQIRFMPTYKLQKETGKYTTTKNRNPSWCDRILYWADDEDQICKCLSYDSIDAKGSDHRPVLGKFLINVLVSQRRAVQQSPKKQKSPLELFEQLQLV